MKPKDITNGWPSGARKIILRNISNAEDCTIRSGSCDGTYKAQHTIPPTAQFVISYNFEHEVFIVWNAAVHSHLHNPKGMSTLSMGEKAKELLANPFEGSRIEHTYKGIKQNGFKNCVEKVTIVGKSALLDFCRHADEYLLPNIFEIPEGKECLYSKAGEELRRFSRQNAEILLIERERESVNRAKRSSDFREKVLELWGNQCIVCGATEQKILEAAHKESVKSGGSDDPQNGFCLCANHHRMYDAAILDIDIESKTFQCKSEDVKAMPWYEVAERRGLKLYTPEKNKE